MVPLCSTQPLPDTDCNFTVCMVPLRATQSFPDTDCYFTVCMVPLCATQTFPDTDCHFTVCMVPLRATQPVPDTDCHFLSQYLLFSATIVPLDCVYLTTANSVTAFVSAAAPLRFLKLQDPNIL